MDPAVARFIQTHTRSPRDEVLDDVAELRHLTLEERVAAMTALARATARLIEASPDADRILRELEQPHPSYRALVARHRKRRSDAAP